MKSETITLNPSNLSSFQFWRDKYKFVCPRDITRDESERRTQDVENLVKQNILNPGIKSCKDVCEEILCWGGGKRLRPRFQKNPAELVRAKVTRVLSDMKTNPNNVSSFILTLNQLQSINIVFASKILRFLDPDNHRYGALDKHVAAFCNKHKITNFKLNKKDRVSTNAHNIDHNIQEFSKYHLWLHGMTDKLRLADVSFHNISGVLQDFTPIDVEMAIFAYCTQSESVDV